MAAGKKNDYLANLLSVLHDYGVNMDGEGALLVKAIRELMGKGLSVSSAVDAALKQRNYNEFVAKTITDSVYKMALVGYGIPLTIRVDAGAQKNIAKKLTNTPWSGDGMKLSARLHGNRETMRTAIISTIQTSINRQDTLNKLSMELYDGYKSGKRVIEPAELPKYLNQLHQAAKRVAAGRTPMKEFDKALAIAKGNMDKVIKRNKAGTPNANMMITYKNLVKEAEAIVKATGKLNTEALDRAAWAAVQEKSRYHADRIARTESARAWFDGFILETQDDELVWGYRWVLSNRHKYVPFDQCDVCANMDIGYGKGVYPKNRVPSIPRHPHCMCSLEVVYFDEIDTSARFNPDGARKYIDSLTDQQKEALFGVYGAKAYEQGGDWQKLLRGWGGFERPVSRLNTKDVGQLSTATLLRQEQIAKIKHQKWNSLLHATDFNEVQRVLAQATEPELNFWVKYGDYVDGDFYFNQDGAHYNPSTKKVNLNISLIDDRMKRINGSSNTRVFFHEAGHLFDDNVLKSSTGKQLVDILPNLRDKLEADYLSYANKILVQNGRKNVSTLDDLPDESRDGFVQDLLADGDLKNAISDIVGGLTGNWILGKYGHDKRYWNYSRALEQEFIAHAFEASMMKGERLDVMLKYFPKAYHYVKAEFDKLGGESL